MNRYPSRAPKFSAFPCHRNRVLRTCLPLSIASLRGIPAFAALWLGLIIALPCGAATSSPSAAAVPWSFHPITKPTPPARVPSLPELNVIDAFLNERLSREGLAVSPPADRPTLLRRVHFDLTGLPPTPKELEHFLADTSPNAFDAVVEKLLASPRYGERWGRHWMDVVRYADTAGDNADYPVPELHRYRDYIIDSFNHDKPYSRFLEEQLAGDVLVNGASEKDRETLIVATGFLALSRRYGTGPYELWHLTLENTLETVGQAFMGLNLKCARCHDHKFDPIAMREYYGLYGIFESTEFPWAGSEEIQSKQFNRQKFVSLESEASTREKLDRWHRQIETLKRQIQELERASKPPAPLDEARKKSLAALKSSLRTLEKRGAPPDLKVAYAVKEGTPKDSPIHRRGDPGSPENVVPRCVPKALESSHPFAIEKQSSGRLEFARWLTSPGHPLTARVLVNRIWHHHFGSGLVNTPNNLGSSAPPPTHPELLDYLAARFKEEGWSIKSLHRLMLRSAAYQRSSKDIAASRNLDPANRNLWRFSRRRLEAEPLRDSLLFVSGELSLAHPTAHPFPGPERWTWTQHTPFKERYESQQRTVYLMTQRLQKHPFMGLFDGPDSNSSTESRRTSTVPQQALYALNNEFLERCAKGLADRILSGQSGTRERIALLHALAWSRWPTPAEYDRFTGGHRDLLRASQTVSPGGLPEEHEKTAWISLAKTALISNEFVYVD